MNYALITGATSGMGLVYAERLAAMGYSIVVVSNRTDDNIAVARRLCSEYGVDARGLYADLCDRNAPQMIYDTIKQWGIDVEILISNAGMLLFSQLHNTDPENLRRIVALHCATPTMLCRLFADDMRRRGGGYILLVSSATAWMPYPTISLYAATKAYLRSFARSLWFELRPYGVAVTALYPGAVDTPLYSLAPKYRRCLRRCGVMLSAEDVVQRALRAMFCRRHRCIPGWFTKLVVGICAVMPDCLLLPVLKIPAVKRLLERL